MHDLHEPPGHDREISLGTTTILGIFFALALLCAVFFGFGYSLGRRSVSSAASPSDQTTGLATTSSKPAPGNPASLTSSKPSADAAQSEIVPIDSPDAPLQDSQPAPGLTPVSATISTVRADRRADKPNLAAKLPPTAQIAAATPGFSVVQVAAMSHQEDADVVAADLKHRGYAVAIRHEPQDKLFHVQIGPFSARTEADAMRQRLQSDGYNNSIVK
ncbi:MAG TPA: SPOR domain-containing protein [Edaphobacter sp.]|nr:SPOR domain-containing protein [Edaphobacter sp.]